MTQPTQSALKIAIAANFLATQIRDSLTLWLETLGIAANLVFAPYDLVIQQLLDPVGVFADADLGVIFLQIERWCGFKQQTPTATVIENFETFCRATELAAQHSRAPAFLIISCPLSVDTRSDADIALLEDQLFERLRALPNVDFVSRGDMDLYYPVKDYRTYFDVELHEVDVIHYSELCFAVLGTMVARRIYTRFRGPRKVIVVDCDNTLWSGCCGEAGPLGVTVEDGNRALQKLLIEKAAHGRLVCLCSKNNESDISAVFERNPHMLLRREHLSAKRVNWHSKVANLRSLSAELGLSLDAFIFLDDDLFECESVKALCPEVCTVQIPKDQVEFSRMLLQIWDFDRISVTREDEQRVRYYQQDAERHRVRDAMLSLEQFLESLDLAVQISPLRPDDVARAAQLMQRVNQFNLNGIRRTASDLNRLLSSGTCFTVQARDRFGDYGQIGLMIYRFVEQALHVRSLLLSCRALGRGIERRIAMHLAEVARSSGSVRIEFDFHVTSKNAPLCSFLIKLGVTEEVSGRAFVMVDELCKSLGIGANLSSESRVRNT